MKMSTGIKEGVSSLLSVRTGVVSVVATAVAAVEVEVEGTVLRMFLVFIVGGGYDVICFCLTVCGEE